MRLRGVGLTLTGPEGKSPPLPFVTVDDSEGGALIALYPKNVIDIDATPADEEAIVDEPVGGAPTAEFAGEDILLGSSIQPAFVAIGDIEVPLGTIVAAACGNLPPAEWNALADEDRERRIAATIVQGREFAGRDADNGVPNDGTSSDGDAAAAPADAGSDAESDGEPDSGGEEAATRRQAIADAIDLLDADGFVKTGERAGRPKVKAVADILDDPNVTTEEIDAVFAEREAE